MATLVSHPLIAARSPTDFALRVAENCAAHGLPLPAEYVRALVGHVHRVHDAPEAMDRFLRDVELGAQIRSDRAFPVPARVARGFRNQIRRALGWPMLGRGDDP